MVMLSWPEMVDVRLKMVEVLVLVGMAVNVIVVDCGSIEEPIGF